MLSTRNPSPRLDSSPLSTTTTSSQLPPQSVQPLQTLSLHIVVVNLPEHHPSNFATLDPGVLSKLLEASVTQHFRNKVKSSRTKTLIRPVLTKKYLVKFEKYTGTSCPPEALELAWKCIVDEDFPPASFDRPAVFSSSFTELVATVSGQVAR